MALRKDADRIISESIKKMLPDEAVTAAISERLAAGGFGSGRLYVVSIGKAGWQMAAAASKLLGDSIEDGVVVTKYDHIGGELHNIRCFEAGHPVPDENSFKATRAAIELVSDLNADDTVLFLVSGGGSALFESPLISGEELSLITSELLACGADIIEINTIRKRLSSVKGGKFAKLCEPAHVFSIVLSDILGDPLDMIASGPAYPDSSSSKDALAIIRKYNIPLSEKAMSLMETETPKELNNVETHITGSVRNLCKAAANECKKLGYEPVILTDMLTCEARDAGSFLGAIARTHSADAPRPGLKGCAFIAGGETVVHLTGHGKGGRNQEIALSAATQISGLPNVCVFSVGSDGTDGPTDAAGGYSDGNTMQFLKSKGFDIFETLKNNDSYNALELTEGLIKTGTTGTNVNDFAVALIEFM